MSIPGSANPLLLTSAVAGGYFISRSVRLNSADSAYFSRTPASSGNRKTWTWAGWVKRSKFGGDQVLFDCRTGSSDSQLSVFYFNNVFDALEFTGPTTTWFITAAAFRDCSAWMHVVLALDTTQVTISSRIRLYVNGSQITTFNTSAYPNTNVDLGINQAAVHGIGAMTAPGAYLNGYLADIHFIDGQALAPTSFGEFSATTGVWMPKAYTGTYGTNGFHLDFSNNASTAALGTDTSGNGNTWSVNNISVAAGAGNDSLVDVPTNGSEVDTGLGNQVRGNYCTLNPLNAKLGTGSVSNGNLDFVGPSGDAAYNYIGATFGIDTSTSTGWYYEVTQTTYGQFAGVALLDQAVSASSLNTSYIIGHPSGNSTAGITYTNNGAIANYGAALSTGNTSWTSNGDVIGIAIKDNKIWFAKNGTWISGSPSAGTSPSITLASTKYVTPALVGINSAFLVLNAGARSFAYTAPSGFKALCTANLPAPVVTKPSTVMDVKLYTGNGSTQTISGLGFSPDLVWIKCGSVGSTYHSLYDIVRGAYKRLSSNVTDAEYTYSTTGLTAFSTSSFTVADDTAGSDNVNGAVGGTYSGAAQYAAWTWDAGSSTVTNTAGSITSSCRTNASAGFSIVSYTGSGAQATVGHGLGVSPGFIVAKSRTATGGYGWAVYHSSLGKDAFLNLNATSASTSFSNYWGTATPNSTVFGVGNGSFDNNTGSMIAYVFAPVAGYSSFGSYTGNGSTDGPFVYTGFRPKYILIKRTDAAEDWAIRDVSRSPYNASIVDLAANSSGAEYSSASFNQLDIISNGFKPRNTRAMYNASGGTYVWAAFAESPFQYARAR